MSDAPPAPGVRDALRSATRPDHEQVDALFARFDLSRRADYVGFLSRQAAAHLPIEAALDEAGAARLIDDWPARRRADLLRQDLADLGAAPAPAIAPPTVEGDAASLGAIYVLEGSRLGGAMLRRALPADLPSRFMAAPARSGAWRRLLDLLEHRLADPADRAAAIDAARATFAAFAAAARRD